MTAPGQDPVNDLAAAYALGALSPEEARRFEAYLATSPDAQREVAELRETAALLALGATDARPSAELRERVLARVSRDQVASIADGGRRASGGQVVSMADGGRGPARRVVPPLYWLALAASLVLTAGLGLSLKRAHAHEEALQQMVASSEAALAQRQRELVERQATLSSILEPGVKLYQLTASGDPEPGVQLFWNQQRKTAIIYGFRLKPVPSGREYQLWFIKDGKPVPSVTFTPAADGHATVEKIPVPEGGALSAAAVTIEPAGGSQQPTTSPIMVAAFQKS